MQWVAYYADDTHLRQYNDDGKENRYADIDRTRLTSFALYDGGEDPAKWVNGTIVKQPYIRATRKLLHLHLEPGQRLIYRRLTAKTVGAEHDVVCYLIGWQQTVEAKNIQSICYVFEEGTIEVAGRWHKGHLWFDSVVPVPSEIKERSV